MANFGIGLGASVTVGHCIGRKDLDVEFPLLFTATWFFTNNLELIWGAVVIASLFGATLILYLFNKKWWIPLNSLVVR